MGKHLHEYKTKGLSPSSCIRGQNEISVTKKVGPGLIEGTIISAVKYECKRKNKSKG